MKTSDSPYHSLTSYGGHTKRIVGIGILVVAVLAVIYYFTLPAHGDTIAIPPDLGIAVKDHFREKTDRDVVRMQAFHCDSFQDGGSVTEGPDAVLEVILENRRARFEEDERSARWAVVAVYEGDRLWEINSMALPAEGERPDPCRR